MASSVRRTMRAAGVGLMSLAAGCATVDRPELVPGRPIAVPADEGNYFVFESSGARRHVNAVTEPVERPADAGDPVAAAFDVIERSTACVVHTQRVALVDLASMSVAWHPNPLAGARRPVRGVSMGAGIAAVWTDTRVGFVRDDGSVETSDLTATLRALGATYLDFVFPRSDREVVVVASKRATTMSDGAAFVARLDRSAGTWQSRMTTQITDISSIVRSASNGGSIYLAARIEKKSRAGRGRMWFTDVLLQIDPVQLTTTRIAEIPRQELSLVLEDFAAGTDSLSLLFRGGRLEIFRMIDGLRATPKAFQSGVEGARSIAWISEGKLMAVTPDGAKVVEFD